MADRDSVIIHIDGDDTGYELSLKQVESKTTKSTNKISSELKAVNGVAVGVATAIGTIGAAVVGLGVKYNAEMEQYKAGFTTMLGSAEQADKTISSLKSFAEKTPFELTDLANASTTLLAFGEDVNNLESDLKMLGDISLGNQEKFKGLALVFGQVQSQGKLMGQDLLQMINQGFNPLQIISEKTGESMASLKDKMAAGQISFEMVADAMRTATSEGGQFFNAMEAQSKTFTGQVSTLKDNVTSLFGEMSEDISQALTEDVLPKAIEMVGDLKEMWADGTLQKWIKGATVALTAFGGAVVGVNVAVFANDMVMLVKGTKDFTAATKLGTAAQKLFNAELLKNPYTWAAVALGALVAGVATYAITHESAAKKIKESHDEAIESISSTATAELAQAETAMVLKNRLYELEGQIKSNAISETEANEIQEEFNGTAKQLEEIIPEITTALYDETGAINIQKGTVEALTQSYYELAKAKAMANAYQSYIDQTAKDLVEVNEKLKPYETGEKDKTYYSSYLGMDLEYRDYADLVKLRDQYNRDMEGYINELNTWQQQAAKNSTNEIKKEEEKKTKYVNTESQKRVTTTQKAYDKEFKGLKYYHEIGEKSDEEYYKELGELRNKYFEEGSEEWMQYSAEIYKWQKSILTKVKEDSVKAVEEFQKAKQEIVKGLNDDVADTYQTVTIQDGDKTLSYTKLPNIGAENKKLEEYNGMLDRLFERTGGELPDYVMQQLKSMNVDEGINYVSAMLRASDNDFEAYINGINEKAEKQGLIADKFLEDDAEKLTSELTKIYGTIPDGFFDIGEDSATEFAEGFGTQLQTELNKILTGMVLNLGAMASPIMSGLASGNQYASNYYNNYYLQSSNESVMSQQTAIRNQNTLNEMRGTN